MGFGPIGQGKVKRKTAAWRLDSRKKICISIYYLICAPPTTSAASRPPLHRLCGPRPSKEGGRGIQHSTALSHMMHRLLPLGQSPFPLSHLAKGIALQPP